MKNFNEQLTNFEANKIVVTKNVVNDDNDGHQSAAAHPNDQQHTLTNDTSQQGYNLDKYIRKRRSENLER